MSRPLGQLGLLTSPHILVQYARVQFIRAGIASIFLQHVHVCYLSNTMCGFTMHGYTIPCIYFLVLFDFS